MPSCAADGTQATVQLPGHNPQAVQKIDSNSESTTQTNRPDGGTVNTPANPLGQAGSRSGAGVLPANFGYDVGGTGNMTSLTTFQNPNAATFGQVTGAGSATTNWAYDQNTGTLASKTYADGTQDVYQYDASVRLSSVTRPQMTANSFEYDAAGDLVSSAYLDSSSGWVSSSTPSLDEFDRPLVTDQDNGKTYTQDLTYNAQGQVASEEFGSAGDATVSYEFGQNGAPPAALDKITLADGLAGAPAQQQTQYSYDPATRQLQSIAVNGLTLSYQYLANSNQVNSMSVGSLNLQWIPDTSDQSRIGWITATDQVTRSSVFVNESGFSQEDQRAFEWIFNGSLNAHYTYTYDPSHGDALTAVKQGTTTLYSYVFDGVGNFTTNSGVSAFLGTPNSLNEYSSLTYNGRGDLTGDATANYAYDALDRLIQVTPKSPTSGSTQEQYGYDSQGRRLWMDVNSWNPSSNAWQYAYSRHYVWDGNQLTAVLDQNNVLLQQYTYGPMGLAAITDYSANPTSPKTYIAVIDAHGNTAQLIDPGNINNGTPATVVADYYYDPYGRLLSSSGPEAGICVELGKGYMVDAVAPWLGFAPNPDGTSGADRVLNWFTDTYMQRDPAGEITGGLNLHQAFGGDPINNVDPTGTTSETVNGVTGIRWVNNGGEGHAEIGIEVTTSPSWYNSYLFGISPETLADSVRVKWVSIYSLPRKYASAQGLQQLARAALGPQNNAEWAVLDAFNAELDEKVGVQRIKTALVNTAGPTGLGPSGEGFLGSVFAELFVAMMKIRAAAQTGGTQTGAYRVMRRDLPDGVQANHLNQNAVYRGVIPEEEGLAVRMQGNAITEPGTPHYQFHESMEKFWDQFRPGGARVGQRPTNVEYGQALQKALQAGGFSPAEASDLAAEAAQQRAAYGLSENALVPRIPGRLNQVKP